MNPARVDSYARADRHVAAVPTTGARLYSFRLPQRRCPDRIFRPRSGRSLQATCAGSLLEGAAAKPNIEKQASRSGTRSAFQPSQGRRSRTLPHTTILQRDCRAREGGGCGFAAPADLGGLCGKRHNATSPNNARWRWFGPGSRNPPVMTDRAQSAAGVCSKLLTFKIGHCKFQNRPPRVKTGQYPADQ